MRFFSASGQPPLFSPPHPPRSVPDQFIAVRAAPPPPEAPQTVGRHPPPPEPSRHGRLPAPPLVHVAGSPPSPSGRIGHPGELLYSRSCFCARPFLPSSPRSPAPRFSLTVDHLRPPPACLDTTPAGAAATVGLLIAWASRFTVRRHLPDLSPPTPPLPSSALPPSLFPSIAALLCLELAKSSPLGGCHVGPTGKGYKAFYPFC